MARKPGSSPQAMRSRAAKTAAAISPASPLAQDAPKKKPFNPAQFAKEVRAEARKISWTSRKETWITSVMVGIMVVLAAVFFLVVDQVLGWGLRLILQLTQAG